MSKINAHLTNNHTHQPLFRVRFLVQLFQFETIPGSNIYVKALKRARVNVMTYRDLAIALHDADLDVLGPRLYYFQQALDSKFNSVITTQVIFVILL